MISYGIDIGTTTVRATAVEIRPGAFGARETKVLGHPLCALTPYSADRLLLLNPLVELLENWSQSLPPPDLGTLLFTGEAQRAGNSLAIADTLTRKWEGLLSAQLNPRLESRLAAYGAHAVSLSAQRPGQPVLHLDIGGGTTNLAWIENGKIEDTACLDLGARKWIFDKATLKIQKRTAQGKKIESLCLGLELKETFTVNAARTLSEKIAQLILFPSPEQDLFLVTPWSLPRDPRTAILSVSGGIVECLGDSAGDPFQFGDLGPGLAQSLVAQARAAGWEVHLSSEAGRATALGVSAYSFQFSGGSVHSEFHQSQSHVPLFWQSEWKAQAPLPSVFALAVKSPISDCGSLAQSLIDAFTTRDFPTEGRVILLLKENLAKTLGYELAKRWPALRPRLLILDEIDLADSVAGSPLRTVDLRYATDSGRYALVVKSLLLF